MATANATWPPPPPPPSPPPPPFTSVGCEDADACSYFDVSDSEIVTSLGIFAAMGAVLLVTFGAIRHQAPIFFGRRRLRNLVRGGQSATTRSGSEKPPRRTAFFSFKAKATDFTFSSLRRSVAARSLPLLSDLEPGTETANAQTHRPPPIPRPDGTWSDAVFGWMTHVLRVPDKELVATAGIDALAFIRVCQFGIQLFFPITVLSICVFIPVHASGNSLDQEREDFLSLGGSADELRSGLNSRLMRTTAANIANADPVMWLHVVTNWLIVVYATWLLRRHTRTFALLRQLYLTTAGDTNLWRAVHMPTTILQQMLVQGREVEAEMDVHAMREQVASRDLRRSGDKDEDEDEDEDDASRDAADDDVPPRDLSPTSSMKKKKKFHEKLDMKSGFGISHGSATRRRDAEEDDGFEFDVGGGSEKLDGGVGSAGLSRFAPSSASTPEGLHVSTETDGAEKKGSAPEGDDCVTIDVAADRLEKTGLKRGQMRSPTARASLSYAGARESVTFSDDMADVTVSAGKGTQLKPVRPLRAEGDARHAHREPRVGGMSIEAMAFLATPVLQQSGDGAGENKVISRIKRGLGPKRTGPAIELPERREPKERERVPTVPEGAEEGAEASSSPRLSPGEKPSFRGAVGAVSASTAFDGLGREARRSRGGLKELRNNIKGLKKQQAAKAKAAARGELSSLGVDAATGDVRERGETASMAGAANDAYATPGVSARGSGSSARARASLEYAAPPRASSGSSAGKEAREKEARSARTAPSTAAGETPEPTTSPSPPKKKKLKVPKGMRIGLQAAKAKVAARRDEKAAGGETAAAPGGGETAAPGGGGETAAPGGGGETASPSVAETASPSVAETAAPGGGTSTASAPAAVPPAPSRPPPPDLASPPAGMRIGLASRKTRVPAAETPPAPGPVTESFDPESNRGETRGGEPGSGESGSGSGLVRRALVPASPESAARPPTVYAGRDGTPTVYFGPDGGEGAAAAAAAASRRHTADAGYLERLRQNRTGPALPNPHAPPEPPPQHNPPPGYSANLPPYASPPRHRGVSGQPRRVDGSVMMGVPSFQLDTSRHVIPPPEALSRHGSSKDSLADSDTGSGDGGLTGPYARTARAEEKKKKGKHRRNASAPTKEYLATLGFGGVGLDEAFDLGGNRTQRLKEAEAREAERFERMREIQEEEKKKSLLLPEHGPRTNLNVGGATQKNIGIGARLDSILSGIGKTPGKPTLGANPAVPVGGSSGRTPSKHNRRGSTGLLLFDAAAALASDPQIAQRNQAGVRRPPSGSDLAGGDVDVLGDESSGDALLPPLVSGVSSRGESSRELPIVSLENRQTSGVVAQKNISKLDRTSRMPGPAVDHIGGGSVSPLLASDVKRVLEHVADAHRARHRRQRSAESGGRGSGSNSNSNSPSHSRAGSFRDLSLMDASGRSGSPSDGDDRDDRIDRRRASSRKPSAENADFFDGWVGSEDEDAPDVAIDHEWWAGLNIDEDSDDDPDHNPERFEAYYVDPKTEDYEGSRHGVGNGTRGSGPDAFLPSGKMPRGVAVDGSSRMSYEDDYDDPRSTTIKIAPDAMDAMERGDAKSASAAKAGARAARMVEMPVPDVNARRTVNTYDPDSQKLVSVWAANYTVLMTDLVPVRQSDGTERFPTEAVEAMFANLFPDEFRGIIPVFDHRPVDRLLDQRDELLNALNKCVEKQRRSYQTTYTKRDWRVMTSVDAARADLEQCERAVVLAREAVLAGEPGPSCFAVFATQKAAAEAAQCLLHSGSRRNFRVQPAPGPDNVNWQTLLYRRHQSLYRIFLISPLIAFILLFPSGIFTVGIASACVGDVPTSLDWYCSEDAEGFKIFVSGLLPPILLTLWEVFVVSFFLMYCVQAQNVHASLSSTDRRFLRYYYVWGFANVLLGGITGGALTSFAQDVLGQDNTTYSIQKHLGRILPISSNFFLVFVFFRSVYLPIQRLILPHPGIICWAVRRYLCIFGCAVTPRDRTVKYSPRGLRMGREVGVFLMVAMLGLTFCLTAPMMAPACLLFFVANFVVWRYHVLYVYERGWESNGSMWFTVVELVVWSLLVAQSFMSCVLFSKSAYLEGIALYLTIPYYLYKYVVSIKAEFGSGNSWSVPLGEAAKAPPADFSAEIYTHPSLRPAAMGWHPDVGKVWRGYPGVAVKHTL